jgi:hypothetical protein
MTDGVVVVIVGIAVVVVVKGNLRLLPLLWKGACSALRRPRVDTEYTVVVAVVVAGPPVVVVVPLAAGAAVVAGLLAI